MHAPEAADEVWMRLALSQAEVAAEQGEVPVGCVVARRGELLAAAANARQTSGDPTAHAEVLALREAALRIGDWRLEGCRLYVTLEPCTMCAGALILARIERLIYGAPDPKAGACGSVLDVLSHPGLNHRVVVTTGVLAAESGELLTRFFRSLRAEA